MTTIAMACDHAAFDLKEKIKKYMESKGYEVKDFGTYSADSCDYADFAHPAAAAVESGEYPFGIAMCGSGNGIQMTLNKHQGIRAALCWKPELAALAKQHNDANKTVDAYLDAKFEGDRHLRRIKKIPLANC